MVKIPEELNSLSKIFKDQQIYVVGGWVRDCIIGVFNKTEVDIDICSTVDMQDFAEVLKNSGFTIIEKNKILGTYLISKNGRGFEYARLRKESYQTAGKHNPSKVEFVKDIKEDAKRRDFSINAIYYSIKEKKLYDFYNGLNDIENKIIKTTQNPEKVFENDGVRILRMVRFACALGFEIDPQTFSAAKKNISNLSKISNDWKEREIKKIMSVDTFYSELHTTKDAVKRAIGLLEELGAFKYLNTKI